MPRVVDYSIVQPRLLAGGFTCLYHHSGAFGFLKDAKAIGWIGPDDPTIRDAARPSVRQVPEPHAPTLAGLLQQAWRLHLPGDAWLMPNSHWHYELHFGNRELLEPLLTSIGIDPAILRDRNTGDAIAFASDEHESLRQVTERLLTALRGSDFLLAFPDQQTVCTIHHHRQLWWQTTSAAIASALESIDSLK
jgi:hypothetical protein